MRYLNLDHLRRCIETLQRSLRLYQNAEADSMFERWFRYRNDTAHDDGEAFARETLMSGFLEDVSRLPDRLGAGSDPIRGMPVGANSFARSSIMGFGANEFAPTRIAPPAAGDLTPPKASVSILSIGISPDARLGKGAA